MRDAVWIALCVYNAVVFLVYGIDKLRARRGWRRTPEATLLWMAALFGGPGALLAMRLFRHKTRKPAFAWGVTAMTLLQAGVVVWVAGV